MHPSKETSDIDDSPSKPTRSPRKRRSRSKKPGLALVVEPERLGICRLPADNRVPSWVLQSSFFSVSRSRDELSIVCEEKLVPKSVRCEVGWRAIKVKEPLDPSLIGVLASLANPLTEAGVSIFSISTYDTDYLLVRHKKLAQAQEALEAAGHQFDVEASESTSEESTPKAEAAAPDAPLKRRGSKSRPSRGRAPSKGSSDEESLAEQRPQERASERPDSERRGSEGLRRPRKDSLAGRMADQRSEADGSPDDAPPRTAETGGGDEQRPARRRPESRKRRSRGGRSSSKATSQVEVAASTTDADSSSPSSPSSSRAAEASAEARQEPQEEKVFPETVSKTAPEDGKTGLVPDATIVLRDGTTRRRSLRSQERRERLNRALRKFGAALTSDPRFGDPQPGQEASAATASPEDAAAADLETATDELDLDWEADLEVAAGSPSGPQTATSGDVTPEDIASDDAASDDVASGDAAPSKEAPALEATAVEATAKSSDGVAGKAEAAVFEAATSGAFEGESLSFGREEEEDDDDESMIAEGLFTGAIPQGDVEVTDQSFATLGLSDEILDAVREMGFTHPTPIQAAVIPEALEGVDIIGLAETGSGKTAAFVLPLAERLYHGKGIRGLIICPTREIALQTKAFIDSFGKKHKLRAVAIIGGVKMGPQIDRLQAKPDIVVATPGRLADHLRRRNVDLSNLEELVIDEADHMLDLGFLPQIKEILEQVPEQRRSMMFSATMLPPIERLAQQFMKDPLMIDIRPVNQVAEGIEHRLYLVNDADLKTCLLKLLDEVHGSTLIFARRKLHTEWLARQLQQAGCPADRIHSDRTQAQRVRALRGFREGKFRILVATDVAARGIDVPRIQHVINYGLPESVEDYVHRAGRTARGNSVGIVSTIGTWQDKATVRQIEAAIGVEMPRCSVEGVEPYTEMRPRRKTVRRRRLL